MIEGGAAPEIAAHPVELSPVERAEALIARAEARVAERAHRPHADSNGAETPDSHGSETAKTARPSVDVAEEMLDRAGETIGNWLTTIRLQVQKAAALAREEAEDMVAEAQALRHKQP